MVRSLSVPTVDVRKRIPEDVIRELGHRIADQFHPRRIILFVLTHMGIHAQKAMWTCWS